MATKFIIVHRKDGWSKVIDLYDDVQSVLLAFGELLDTTEITSKTDFIRIYRTDDEMIERVRDSFGYLHLFELVENSHLMQEFKAKATYEWEEVQF